MTIPSVPISEKLWLSLLATGLVGIVTAPAMTEYRWAFPLLIVSALLTVVSFGLWLMSYFRRVELRDAAARATLKSGGRTFYLSEEQRASFRMYRWRRHIPTFTGVFQVIVGDEGAIVGNSFRPWIDPERGASQVESVRLDREGDVTILVIEYRKLADFRRRKPLYVPFPSVADAEASRWYNRFNPAK